jgi:hypothetical protein
MTTVLPAFGRTYANANAAKADWHAGKDFLESASRLACNKQDIPGEIVIRYGARLEKVTAYSAADARKLDKAAAEAKAAQPARKLEFKAWLVELDKAVQSEVGMSYQDLPDVDFWEAYAAGNTPEQGARIVLSEVGFL